MFFLIDMQSLPYGKLYKFVLDSNITQNRLSSFKEVISYLIIICLNA